MVFDMLYLDGEVLLEAPLARRKETPVPVTQSNGNGHGLRDRAARLLRSA